jgi:hypothetical protein
MMSMIIEKFLPADYYTESMLGVQADVAVLLILLQKREAIRVDTDSSIGWTHQPLPFAPVRAGKSRLPNRWRRSIKGVPRDRMLQWYEPPCHEHRPGRNTDQ